MENQSSHEQPTRSARKNLKRKLEEDFEEDRKVVALSPRDNHEDLVRNIRAQVDILDSTFSPIEADRLAAKTSIHVLCELAKNGTTKFFILRLFDFFIFCVNFF